MLNTNMKVGDYILKIPKGRIPMQHLWLSCKSLCKPTTITPFNIKEIIKRTKTKIVAQNMSLLKFPLENEAHWNVLSEMMNLKERVRTAE